MTVPDNATGVESETSKRRISSFFTRSNMAFVGFLIAILCVAVGASMYHPGAGLIAGGLLLAAFSYLLGNE